MVVCLVVVRVGVAVCWVVVRVGEAVGEVADCSVEVLTAATVEALWAGGACPEVGQEAGQGARTAVAKGGGLLAGRWAGAGKAAEDAV